MELSEKYLVGEISPTKESIKTLTLLEDDNNSLKSKDYDDVIDLMSSSPASDSSTNSMVSPLHSSSSSLSSLSTFPFSPPVLRRTLSITSAANIALVKEETLEEKIARVMSGNFTSPGSTVTPTPNSLWNSNPVISPLSIQGSVPIANSGGDDSDGDGDTADDVDDDTVADTGGSNDSNMRVIKQSQSTESDSSIDGSKTSSASVAMTPKTVTATNTNTNASVDHVAKSKVATSKSSLASSASSVNTSSSTLSPQPRRLPVEHSAPAYNNTNSSSSSSYHHSVSHEVASTSSDTSSDMSFQEWSLLAHKHNQVKTNSTIDYEHHVKVAVRVRPFLSNEIVNNTSRRILSFKDDKLVIVNPNALDANPDLIAAAAAEVRMKEWAHIFRFNTCLWSYDPYDKEDEYTSQEGVYNSIGVDMVNNVLNGSSASCYAYGMTGSGKTYTLFGNSSSSSSSSKGATLKIDEDAGLIARVFSSIVDGIKAKHDTCSDTKITISIIEVYNEKIRDVLSTISNANSNGTGNGNIGDDKEILRIREHPTAGPYVEGLTKVQVDSVEDVMRVLHIGQSYRSTSNTAWHAPTSRSHTIVTLELVSIYTDPFSTKLYSPIKNLLKLPTSSSSSSSCGYGNYSNASASPHDSSSEQMFVRAQFIDLAGSERDTVGSDDDRHDSNLSSSISISSSGNTSSSKAKKHTTSPSLRLDQSTEMKQIRRTLSTLGFIIKSLGKGGKRTTLPHRDSVLTWLLRNTLCGDNYTTVLATLSPSSVCYDESLNTLKYAERLCVVGNRSHAVDRDRRTMASTATASSVAATDSTTDTMSLVARQILQQTLTDPQQRLAKGKSTSIEQILLQSASDNSHSRDTATATATATVTDIKNHQQQQQQQLIDRNMSLQSEIVQLQLEVKLLHSDRDSLSLELQEAQNVIGHYQQMQQHLSSPSTSSTTAATITANSNTSSMYSINVEALASELKDMRQLVARKEEVIERLLDDLNEEQKRRVALTAVSQANASEFVSKYDSLKKEYVEVVAEMEQLRHNGQLTAQEKTLLDAEARELRHRYNELKDTNSKCIRDLSYMTEQYNIISTDYDTLKESHRQLVIQVNDTQVMDEQYRTELSLIVTERDSLQLMVDQLTNALQIQQHQAETSLKMLHQRQAALERVEQDGLVSTEEVSRLQRDLQELLTEEGVSLHTELLDAQRLTSMIASMREKMEYMATRLTVEVTEKETMQRRYEEQVQQLQVECANSISHVTNELATKVEACDARATYWESVAKRVKEYLSINESSAAELETARLTETIKQLQEQVTAVNKEKEESQLALKAAQGNMQVEYASLWMAVQELNKLDAVKDKEMQQVINDRNNAIDEKDILNIALKDITAKYIKLQEELDEIDSNIIEATKNHMKFTSPGGGDEGRYEGRYYEHINNSTPFADGKKKAPSSSTKRGVTSSTATRSNRGR